MRYDLPNRLPESTERRCDLRAKGGEGEAYLFEVKAIHDADAIAAALRVQDVYTPPAMAFDTSRAVEGGIRTAVKQLDSTAVPNGDELRLLVLLVRSRYDADVVAQQIVGALYGKRSLIVTPVAPGKDSHLECLYFSHSAFFRHKSRLDGALLCVGNGVTLYLNDYSGHRAQVRQSALARFFAHDGAIYDAAAFEEQGFLSAIDCDADRNNESQILQFVAQKYHLENPRVMHFNRHSGFAVIPWGNEAGRS